MEKHVQPAVDRFKALTEERKEEFYEKLTAFVRFYSFVSQIIPYSDMELEMLYSYSRYLLPKLDWRESGENPNPEKDVEFWYYRLERTMSGSISLETGEPYGVKSPTAVGTGKSSDEAKPLSEFIEVVNKRFGTDFKEEDRLFFEQIKEKACNDDRVIQTAKNNPADKFALGIKSIIKDLMLQRMAENDDIVTRYIDNAEFQQVILSTLPRKYFWAFGEKKVEISTE